MTVKEGLGDTDKIKIFRERFFGRQDVFGRQWRSTTAQGKEIKGFAPACDNLWKDFCHIKTKDGIPCSACKHREYTPVSDTTILEHIKGHAAAMFYVLHEDNSIMFGAIDFDLKPGKEDKGYGFDEVSKVVELVKEMGLPYGLARSTGEGFHLYFFFEKPYPAYMFRSLIKHLYDQAGFIESMARTMRPPPEIFPKQDYVSGVGGLGNGIKPPMIEANWHKERNCFVDDKNEFIPEERQWGYLNDIGRITEEQMESLFQTHSIPILKDDPISGGKTSNTHSKAQGSSSSYNAVRGKWQPPIFGSMEKVVGGCAAFSRLRKKMKKGEVPGHHEGFALYFAALRTQDGMKWFHDNVPGWGEDSSQLRQLEQAKQKNYLPYTCRKMQEEGICAPNTQCFTPKPPIDFVDGQRVVLDNVPKEKWPEPSPIRYAHGKSEDYLQKLKEEAKTLNDMHPDSREPHLEDLIKRVQVFDGKQQKEFRTFLNKTIKVKYVKSKIKTLWAKHSKEYREELEAALDARDDEVKVDDMRYIRKPNANHGYCLMKFDGRTGELKKVTLCSCNIDIEEERIYIEDNEVTRTVYIGNASATGIQKDFEIDTAKWNDNTEFLKFYGQLLGSSFNILRANIDNIRQASMAFSSSNGIQRTNLLLSPGWYHGTFLMPSALIDKDGVRPNTEKKVDLSSKYHAHQLDMQVGERNEVAETVNHIMREMIYAYPNDWCTIGLAQVVMPIILKPLGIVQKLTLFYEGSTGTGKTELTKILQRFWGVRKILNLRSSGAGCMSVSHDFKDALLVIDDYKGLSISQKKALAETIQYSYDGGVSIKLKRDGSQRKPQEAKGSLIVSGEEFMSSQASMIARCIIIETKVRDTKDTRALYHKVLDKLDDYSAVLPFFIKWFIEQDWENLKEKIKDIQKKLYEHCAGKTNADRISFNFAVNYVCYDLWLGFCKSLDVLLHEEYENHLDIHWNHILHHHAKMIDRCAEDHLGSAFLETLGQLIASGAVSIEGLPGFSHDHKPVIGFCNPKPKNVVNLLPDIVIQQVRAAWRDDPVGVNKRAIGRQLIEMGVIVETDKDRMTKQVRRKDQRPNCWVVEKTRLGIFKDNIEVVDEKGPTVNTNPIQQNMDETDEGIF